MSMVTAAVGRVGGGEKGHRGLRRSGGERVAVLAVRRLWLLLMVMLIMLLRRVPAWVSAAGVLLRCEFRQFGELAGEVPNRR